MFVFDIETAPLDPEQILPFAKPFVPPDHPGEFDPASVKTGNLRDAAKISAKIEEARANHKSLVDSFDQCIEAAHTKWASDVMSKAALDPLTGRVLVVGIGSAGDFAINDYGGCEVDVIKDFWDTFSAAKRTDTRLVGHNILRFDLRFLVRRSWILGIDVPDQAFLRGRFCDLTFVDTMRVWSCGDYSSEYISLDALARAMGHGGKEEQEVTGETFHAFWNGTPEQRELARLYLTTDLQLTWNVANSLGIV